MTGGGDLRRCILCVEAVYEGALEAGIAGAMYAFTVGCRAFISGTTWLCVTASCLCFRRFRIRNKTTKMMIATITTGIAPAAAYTGPWLECSFLSVSAVDPPSILGEVLPEAAPSILGKPLPEAAPVRESLVVVTIVVYPLNVCGDVFLVVDMISVLVVKYWLTKGGGTPGVGIQVSAEGAPA
jgi:hypothetical protein